MPLLDRAHRLVTEEDGRYLHAHKLLGVVALFNFAWKGAGRDSPVWWLLLSHAALHLTSFQFRLDSRRNKRYNVIWPEMRWHTMIFAYRSLAAIAVQTYLSPWLSAVLRGPLVLTTMLCADSVTHYFKRVVAQVDAADSTMRGNPYPHWAPPTFVRWHNLFYSVSQVYATMIVLCHTDVPRLYWLLLPIQTAPFCMTLVRKGVIDQAGWHVCYTAALLVNYAIARPPETCVVPAALFHSAVAAFALLRFRFGFNKYALWGAMALLQLWWCVSLR